MKNSVASENRTKVLDSSPPGWALVGERQPRYATNGDNQMLELIRTTLLARPRAGVMLRTVLEKGAVQACGTTFAPLPRDHITKDLGNSSREFEIFAK